MHSTNDNQAEAEALPMEYAELAKENEELKVQLKDMTDQFFAVSQQCERMKDQTSAGFVFNQMRRAWEVLGEEKWEYRPHKFVEICEKMKAQLAAARDVIAKKDEALAFIKRTVKTDQLCSKGNESIWFAANEALALTLPTDNSGTNLPQSCKWCGSTNIHSDWCEGQRPSPPYTAPFGKPFPDETRCGPADVLPPVRETQRPTVTPGQEDKP